MKLLGCTIRLKGSSHIDQLAFTFDDGPHPENSPQIMNLLEEAQGKGTFFLTGRNIIKNRQLVKEIASRGHLIGNHTFNHGKAIFQKKATLHDEIVRTKELIEDITCKENHFLRPPHGIITPSLCSICSDLNLTVVLWSINTMDFKRKPFKSIVQRVRSKIEGGAILLFHECHFRDFWRDYSNSIIALGSILQIVLENRLKPVTVEQLINQSNL